MYVSYVQDEEFSKLAHSCFYRTFLPDVKMKTPEDIKKNILLRSVEGRAREGHAPFRRALNDSEKPRPIRFPNATAYDVAEACNLNPQTEAFFSQKKINEVVSFFQKLIDGEWVTGYQNEKGEPFYGILNLAQEVQIHKQDIPAILAGAYLAACMDSGKYRELVKGKFRLNMGNGATYRVDREALMHHGGNLSDLAKSEHTEKDLEKLRLQGIIVQDGPVSKERTNAYLRKEAGCGSLDDIIKIICGLRLGDHGYYGAVLVDATDTWDKYTTNIIAGGYDELIMDMIKENEETIKTRHPSFRLPSDDEITTIVYLTAKSHYPVPLRKAYKKLFAHCSFRYEHQIEGSTKRTMFESHLAYIRHENPCQITFSHPSLKLNNKMLYRAFERFIEKNPHLYTLF